VFRPSVACQPRPQCILDLAVGPFHQTIALRVVGCGGDVVDLEVLSQPLPQGGGELPPPVSGHGLRYPRVDEGLHAGLGLHVAEQDSL
jgi:hypothetical protein